MQERINARHLFKRSIMPGARKEISHQNAADNTYGVTLRFMFMHARETVSLYKLSFR